MAVSWGGRLGESTFWKGKEWFRKFDIHWSQRKTGQDFSGWQAMKDLSLVSMPLASGSGCRPLLDFASIY